MSGRRLTRPGGRRLVRAAARLFAPCLLACLLCGAVAAYTVVMRGGRRVEIPGEFELTRATLTYETAPGVSVTLPLDHIDVEATELANDEPAGSFLRRVRGEAGRGASRQMSSPTVAPRAARRTITNRDLEAVRRARVESERDYERRRKELGLPSAEEMRRHEEREEAHMRELSRQKAEADAAAERERRARDEELQAEMLLLDAEEYNARRSAESSGGYSDYYSSGVTVITNGRPYYGRRFPSAFRRPPFASSRRAGFGSFGAGRRPPVRHGAGAGFRIDGGTRGVVGFRYRGFQGRPAGRR